MGLGAKYERHVQRWTRRQKRTESTEEMEREKVSKKGLQSQTMQRKTLRLKRRTKKTMTAKLA